MEVSLREITKENYESVSELDVTKEQESYVACNMWSLVESFYNDTHVTRAIYQDEQVVGFFMWVRETKEKISIWRFMIDAKYQTKGIGRIALHKALEEIKQTESLRQIEICYNPNNPIAKTFYSQFGFMEVGMDEDGEDMLAIISLEPI